MLIHQPQLLQQDAGLIRPEAAAVEPDVEQPVVFVVGFLGGAYRRNLPLGSSRSRRILASSAPTSIEPQDGHVVEHDERQCVLELPVGIVPEYDPLPFLVEEAFESRVDLVEVANRSLLPSRGKKVVFFR